MKQAPVFTTNLLSPDSYDAKVSEALQVARVNMNTQTMNKSVVNDTVNNLWIHTEKVHHIVSGEYESYTFAVEDPTDTLNLKNLMLHKQLDGSYLPILFTYDLDTNDLSNSVIQYQVLDKTLVSSTQKSGLIDFIIGTLNPCGWDDSCACWRLDGEIIIIQMKSDTCTIFSEPVETISPGEGSSGGGGDPNAGSGAVGGDPNAGSGSVGGGFNSGPGANPGDGSSDSNQSGNDNADNDSTDDCLQLSNGDCFNGAATEPVELVPLDEQLARDKPDEPIYNISNYLSVFDTSQPATVIINVDQPVTDVDTPNYFTNVGHAFITIRQGLESRSFGYYPELRAKPTATIDPGIFGNDSDTRYDVNVQENVSGDQLQQIIDLALAYDNQDYDLNNQNCTDYVIEVGNISGFNFGDAYNDWWRGGGSNPGTLGQILRQLISSGQAIGDTSGGTSPRNSQ